MRQVAQIKKMIVLLFLVSRICEQDLFLFYEFVLYGINEPSFFMRWWLRSSLVVICICGLVKFFCRLAPFRIAVIFFKV